VRLRTIVTLSHTVSGHARDETCLKFEQSGIIQMPVLYFVLALCTSLNCINETNGYTQTM